MALPNRTRPDFAVLGTLNQPTVGRVEGTLNKSDSGVYRMDFTLKGVRVAVTDATTNGTFGTFKLFDFNEGAVSFLGCRQDYTQFRSDGTGVPGDTVFEIGIGTTAIAAAADGTLGNGVNENVGQAVGLTLAGSPATAAGTAVDGADATALNGTATALDLNLNVSGTAATVDGDGWLAVWGTVSITLAWMGDD